MEVPSDITALLIEWNEGNREALNRLTPFIYQELRKLAQSSMRRERPDHTLQATALVHEVYLRKAWLHREMQGAALPPKAVP